MAVLLAASVEPGRALPQRASERAEFVGEYRGVRYTDDQTYSYTFELWRVNGLPIGLWARVDGLPDTSLTARVTDLELGPQGMVSFSAAFCDVNEVFAGELTDRSLKGTVTLSRGDPVDRKVVDLIKDQSPNIAASLPIAEWTTMVEGRLRRAAPAASLCRSPEARLRGSIGTIDDHDFYRALPGIQPQPELLAQSGEE